MEITIDQFKNQYLNNLAAQCIPDSFGDLCSGWTQETFRQVVTTMTRRGAAPIKLIIDYFFLNFCYKIIITVPLQNKLWFDSAEEMTVLSNKRPALAELFKVMDTNKIGRIDTLELFAVILISIKGKFEIILQNIMIIYGFNNENEFSRDEFHFFLDCFSRGLLKLSIPKGSKVPVNPGKKLVQSDIESLVGQIFPNNIDLIERSDFIEFMTPQKEIFQIIQYFHESCLQSVLDFRQKTLDRIQITHFVRKWLLDITRAVYVKIKEIEDTKEEEMKQNHGNQQDDGQHLAIDGSAYQEAIQSKGVYIDPSNPRKVFHKDSQRRMWKQE